jgi:anti-sigma-K factor RskA
MALNICIGLAKAFKTSQMKYKEENPQEYVIRWETRLMAFQSEYNAQ